MLVIFSSDYFIPAAGFQANYVIHGNAVKTAAQNAREPASTTISPTTALPPNNCGKLGKRNRHIDLDWALKATDVDSQWLNIQLYE